MISMYNIKPKFQALLKPTVAFLYKRGITANQLTVAAILLSFVMGVGLWFSNIWHWGFLFVPIGLLLRMALNALDGMMARGYNMQTRLGEVLNEIGDVLSDMFIYIPLIKVEGVSAELIAFFVGLSVLNEFAGILGKVIGKERRYDGPMGKSDRALVIGLLCLFLYFFAVQAIYINATIGLCVCLMIVSTFLRVQKSLKDE
jgi:CDP-diacylglycerol--glycerol-3-phosphate 3-phosphatidyltransferase